MSTTPIRFSATGTIQLFTVPASGAYVIEAAGGQGGAGREAGGGGNRARGVFHLKRGDVVKIVVGRQGRPGYPAAQAEGSAGGHSVVWGGPTDLPLPIRLMLAADGGSGGAGLCGGHAGDDGSRLVRAHGWVRCGTRGVVPAPRVGDVLRSGGVAEGNPEGSGLYNTGEAQENARGVQTGDGCVSIVAVRSVISGREVTTREVHATAGARRESQGSDSPFPEGGLAGPLERRSEPVSNGRRGTTVALAGVARATRLRGGAAGRSVSGPRRVRAGADSFPEWSRSGRSPEGPMAGDREDFVRTMGREARQISRLRREKTKPVKTNLADVALSPRAFRFGLVTGQWSPAHSQKNQKQKSS